MPKTVRTLIAFEASQKAWLDRRSRSTGRPVAQLVRDAVELARRSEKGATDTGWDGAIESVKGIRHGEDGLATQRKLREEWS
ncbi:MAG TPA: hypothetical protein PKO15_14025 [Fibrobacteria bacterium]|nr:hypothetical protein [Fibrobacteria bacterium]HOX52617.1 hypothetical protein [Fibrobacteria bacterium]